MTPSTDPLRGALSADHEVRTLSLAPQDHAGHMPAGCNCDRRRPLRDQAQQQLLELDVADRSSLVAYWASVAPAAFLLACEAFEQDTR